MDATRFDQLTRVLAAPGARRGLLRFLTALPLLGGLALLWGEEEAEGKGRRKRRRRRHKHGQGRPKNRRKRKKNKKRKCKAKSRSRICAGKCGVVKNKKTCKKKVNCGPCACDPPCPACQICEGGIGQCRPDAALNGQPCGGPGEECADGICVQTCKDLPPTANLQDAIDATPAGGTLTLCPGTWTLNVPVSIAQDLTLRGAGAGLTTLNGTASARVLTIIGGRDVSVQDLTISEGAGGIDNAGTLSLGGVAVTGNTTTSGGGGIVNRSSGTLTLEAGCHVAGNAADFGGGISNDGGAVILQDGSVVGGDTQADTNTSNDAGGGIFNSSNGTLTLEEGSRIAGNAATTGGGIYNFNSTVDLQNGSRVVGNEATIGGGIYNDGGTVTVDDMALVCDNGPGQCNGMFNGDCPNPANGSCPD